MKKILVFILLFIIIGESFSQADIVGGSDCDISEYPWHAATWGLQENGNYEMCGAAIINQYWVVTAAHCVYGNEPNTITVRVGSTNNFANDGIAYLVDEIIIHPNYSNDNEEPELAYMSHDIALVKIIENSSFEFNEVVQPISLITETEVMIGSQEEDVMATITGWGQDSSGNTTNLKFIELPIISNTTAIGLTENNTGFSGNWNSYSIDESMICVQNIEGGPCFGDSGGPLIVRNNNDTEWMLAGVFTKLGLPCGSAKPSVFIKISHVQDWICENTNSLNTSCLNNINTAGCTNVDACNYNPDATEDDGSCDYSCLCESDTVFITITDTIFETEFIELTDTIVEIEYVDIIITEYVDCETFLPCDSGIEEVVEKSKTDGRLYNLLGQEINRREGIYIEGGEVKYRF